MLYPQVGVLFTAKTAARVETQVCSWLEVIRYLCAYTKVCAIPRWPGQLKNIGIMVALLRWYSTHEICEYVSCAMCHIYHHYKQTSQYPDHIFNCIFLTEKIKFSSKISLFVAKGSVNDILPLSETMTVSLLTHICVIRSNWVEHGLGTRAIRDNRGQNPFRYYVNLVITCHLYSARQYAWLGSYIYIYTYIYIYHKYINTFFPCMGIELVVIAILRVSCAENITLLRMKCGCKTLYRS